MPAILHAYSQRLQHISVLGQATHKGTHDLLMHNMCASLLTECDEDGEIKGQM